MKAMQNLFQGNLNRLIINHYIRYKYRFKMKKHLFTIGILSVLLITTGCKQTEEKARHIPAAPQMEAQIDRSEPVKIVDVEQASRKPAPLKLSQIASEIEYYTVGDARFTVTQAIELPDSNAFITFNNPRIYYRKQGIPSKRYGFKALAYKWNNEMNGQNMFYDKKTTRMYVALSGKTQETRRTGTDSIPCISVLPPLDTMLTIQSYIFPESPIEKYPLGRRDDKLLGFSSTGYTLCNQSEATGYALQIQVERRGVGPAHDDRQHSVLPNVLLEHRTRPDDFHDALLRHRLPITQSANRRPALRYPLRGARA